jgi:hypothetical protein
MGHLVHGSSLAFPSQVERYGFLTTNGKTGGFNEEATTDETSDAATAATRLSFMIQLQFNTTEDGSS